MAVSERDLAIYERDGGTCTYCGCELERDAPRQWRHLSDSREVWQVDHVLASKRGGSDSPDNLALACGQCNIVKGSSLLADWQPQAGLPREVAARLTGRGTTSRGSALGEQMAWIAEEIAKRVPSLRAGAIAEWAALTDSGRLVGPPLHEHMRDLRDANTFTSPETGAT